MAKQKKSNSIEGIRNSLDYFIAGVPALGFFEIQADHLAELVRSPKKGNLSRLNQVAEVALIGLCAYFEAFCKAHFASLINICPETLRNLVERRKTATVNLKHIVTIRGEVVIKLGNLISEEYDFGSAKEINGLYQDLLRITPFSANEAKKYSHFLSDRNLLVHHGGVFTYNYSSQRFAHHTAPGLPHWDSLVIGQSEFDHWNAFVVKMATKIATTSQSALEGFIARENLTTNPEQTKAIGMLGSSR
jgi:hypothetical protein